MTVGELRERLKQYSDNMELEDPEPSIYTVEEYLHPAKGWETLCEQTDTEARIRRDFKTRHRLRIYSGADY